MPSHRATDKQRGRSPRRLAPDAPGAEGRRKAVVSRRRRVRISTVSTLTAATLLVTGIGAAAASHLIGGSRAGDRVVTAAPASSTAASHGTYVSDGTGRNRGLDPVSRSGSRPRLTSKAGSSPSVGSSTTDSARHSSTSGADSDAAGDTTRSDSVVDAATRAADERTASLETADSRAEEYERSLRSDTWVLPTSGFHITEWFGDPGPYWATGYHTGIDFATAYGTPVVAVADATVFQTGWDGPYGNQIRLQFSNGDQVWYNHLSAIEVHKGEKVTKGEKIGRVGETGNAYGYHLHFEYRLAKDLTLAVDPKPFFAAHGIALR